MTVPAIKVATMKSTDDFCYKWKPSRAYHKTDTFHGEQKWMGHKGGHWPWRLHWMNSSAPKGTSQVEVTSSSKKIKPAALAIVELQESEGINGF